jgi:ketohexokinase
MASILGVGVATLDIINRVQEYPAEDDEIRAFSQRRVRGGNVTNTLVVLSELGHQCAWAGMLPAHDPDALFVEQELKRHAIDRSWVRRPVTGKLPVSCVTLSRATGSRTIVHYRDLPEYPFEAFEAIELEAFSWLHFEGRAVAELGAMLEKATGVPVPVSLEVEKPRQGIETLFVLPDVLLFSRNYARTRGYDSPQAFLLEVAPAGREAWLAWGEEGAWCRDRRGELHFRSAEPVAAVDTLGAGDVFNAAVIHGRLRGWTCGRILQAAVRLAGAKCAREGFEGLAAVLHE